MKTIIKWISGIIAVVAFLAICSEPAPGEEVSLSAFMIQKIIGFVVLVGSITIAMKISNN